jgi:hypothetical protein
VQGRRTKLFFAEGNAGDMATVFLGHANAAFAPAKPNLQDTVAGLQVQARDHEVELVGLTVRASRHQAAQYVIFPRR